MKVWENLKKLWKILPAALSWFQRQFMRREERWREGEEWSKGEEKSPLVGLAWKWFYQRRFFLSLALLLALSPSLLSPYNCLWNQGTVAHDPTAFLVLLNSLLMGLELDRNMVHVFCYLNLLVSHLQKTSSTFQTGGWKRKHKSTNNCWWILCKI